MKLSAEFHMTNDSHLFFTQEVLKKKGAQYDPETMIRKNGKEEWWPLYSGGTIHQFTHTFSDSKYWVNLKEGEESLSDSSFSNGFQSYRFGFRDVASNTNNRTLISAVIPKSFHGNKLPTAEVVDQR
ncbi:hypothetical protein LEP1GSC088_0847 [Leptospira interrogans str. L1207]|nr:hypothetical protein LEP1GSC088_0847 [Leptospira interrogans str. L1207]